MPKLDLSKGWKEALLGASLVTTGAMASPVVEQPKPYIAEDQVSFDPHTLHPELLPIAHLESAFGKNMNHAPHSKGIYHTAVGAVGFKPSTAHERYLKSIHLQSLFPSFEDPEKFIHEFKSNPQFYNAIAGSHWNTLKKLVGGSTDKAAYAWRWGAGAASKADDNTISKDPYVQKYKELSLGKSALSLIKMAIRDLKPGKLMAQKPTSKVYNYDHILKPEHIAEGYSLGLHDTGDDFTAKIEHNGKTVGHLTASKPPNEFMDDHLRIGEALINEEDPKKPLHRGKKLRSSNV